MTHVTKYANNMCPICQFIYFWYFSGWYFFKYLAEPWFLLHLSHKNHQKCGKWPNSQRFFSGIMLYIYNNRLLMVNWLYMGFCIFYSMSLLMHNLMLPQARPWPVLARPGLIWPGHHRPGRAISVILARRPGLRPDLCTTSRPGQSPFWPGLAWYSAM